MTSLRRGLAAAAVMSVVAVLSLLAIFSRGMRTSIWGSDDMFIVLVYARHLLDSGTFYWNASDGALDGFTSFLDVFIKAILFRLWRQNVLDAVFISTLIFHALAAMLAMLVVASRDWSRQALGYAALVGVVVGTERSLAEGSAMLLETGPFVCLILGTLLFVPLGRSLLSKAGYAVMLASLPFGRPEGLILAVIALGVLLYESTFRSTAQHNAWVVWMVLGWLALFVLWRIHTFGYWAPNTYYAKTSDSRLQELRDGLVYVSRYLQYPTGALKLVALAAVPILAYRATWTNEALRVRCVLATTLAIGALALTIASGGDSFRGARFLSVPAALTAVALGTMALGMSAPRSRLAAGALAVIVVLQVVPVVRSWPANMSALTERPRPMAQVVGCETIMARNLWMRYPNASIGQSDFQRVKYYLDQARVVDLHGLNDRAIAHRPTNGQVLFGKLDVNRSLDLPLDILIVGLTYNNAQPMAGLDVSELLRDSSWVVSKGTQDALAAKYDIASVPGCEHGPSYPRWPNRYLNFLVRKGL